MPTPSRYSTLVVLFVCGLSQAGLATQTAAQDKTAKPAKASDDFDKIAVPFLQKHCYHCHGPDKKKAGIAFQTYKDEEAVIKNRKVWHSVQDMVHGGEMPPQERPRPTLQETDAFLQVVRDIFDRADRTAKRDPVRDHVPAQSDRVPEHRSRSVGRLFRCQRTSPGRRRLRLR